MQFITEYHDDFVDVSKSNNNIIELYRDSGLVRSTAVIDQYGLDKTLHAAMLHRSGISSGSERLVYYIRASTTTNDPPTNSVEAKVTTQSLERYSQIEHRLSSLSGERDDDGDPIVEDGAIKTALGLVHDLRSSGYSPPKISWHGGDAVVMMWALGDTTYAITATDGGMGYVVRQNRKTLRIADSISPLKFRLEDIH